MGGEKSICYQEGSSTEWAVVFQILVYGGALNTVVHSFISTYC